MENGAAIGFRLLDHVIHGWDVAVSTGQQAECDDETLTAVARVAEQIPVGEARERAGSSFGPVLDAGGGRHLRPCPVCARP